MGLTVFALAQGDSIIHSFAHGAAITAVAACAMLAQGRTSSWSNASTTRARSPLLRVAEQVALTHHEWWDGGGYPAGLREDEIPLAGRIVAVADVFDALTHDRPYKLAASLDEALEEIAALSGRQFDPGVVTAFEELDHQALLAPVEALAAQAA